jgi:uncharacterized protein (DUF2147 family)
MKKLYILAALLMASTSAHAGNSISFEIEGHKVRIEAPKHCDQLSCIKISAPGLSGSGFNFKGVNSNHSGDDDSVPTNSNPPAQQAAPAPAAQAPAAPAVSSAPSAPSVVASTSAAPAVGFDAPAASAPAAVSTPAPQAPQPVAAAPAPAPTTPLGIWATEENKGNVRIENCGSNLCGYAANSGERILINMKPSDNNNKWTGRIHDPDSGSNYDSTIAMKGSNVLKVQGCAFGGMFCGGQTWKRVS